MVHKTMHYNQSDYHSDKKRNPENSKRKVTPTTPALHDLWDLKFPDQGSNPGPGSERAES